MKKKSLISLSSLLLAGALLVGCATKTAPTNVNTRDGEPTSDNEDNPNPRNREVEVLEVKINLLEGVELDAGSSKVTEIKVRSGTLWSVFKNKLPIEANDFKTPDPSYIDEVYYSTDEAGKNKINDNTPIRSDNTNLYLHLTHAEPEPTDQKCKVNWKNDNDAPLVDPEEYRVGETPFYKGMTPVSVLTPGAKFVGWEPEISEITDTTERTYTAQYEEVGAECTVTYDLNYDSKKDLRKVKKNTTASPLTPDPVRQHYTFDKWYEDATCKTEFIFAEHTIVDDSTIIYAGWTPDVEKVTIDPNGGKFTDETTSKKVLDVDYNTTWAEIKADTEHPIGIEEAPEGSSLDGYKYQYYDASTASWKDITDDSFRIEANLSIKVVYESFKTTLKFEDDYEGGTMPADKEIKYGTKWVEIKDDCEPTVVKEGFTFDHYYIDSGTTPIPVDDKYVFEFPDETSTITLHAVYRVTVKFNNDNTKGRIDYASAEFKTGDKWGDVKAKYLPTVIDPAAWAFKNYTTDETPVATVDDNYIIKKPLTFTANYEGAAADSFEEDSWLVFTSYLDGKTFKQLSTEGAYKDEFDKKGTFVGLTRTIDLQGSKYTVRVIDEASEGSSTLAHNHLLTFEFTNLLDLAIPYSLKTDDNNYNDSFVNAYLNDIFIYGLPNALQRAIKPTDVKYYDPSTSSVKDDLSTKLFVLSASELNFTTFPDYGEGVLDEGSYAYYNKGDVSKQKAKLDAPATYLNYWTRSADISGTTEYAWNINEDGTLGVSDNAILVNSSGTYVAPAFEI